jgi:hypothetical protein
MSCSVALRPLRQVVAELAVASSSQASSSWGVASQNRYALGRYTSAKSCRLNASAHRSFATSSSRRRPPSPEPAISRPLDTPPSPIPSPGKIKSQQPTENVYAAEKDEACSTLSPSSPSAPRSQGNSIADKGKGRETQSSNASAIETASESPKAIPPEIVSKPSVGRKGSGKAFKAQKAALTLVSHD